MLFGQGHWASADSCHERVKRMEERVSSSLEISASGGSLRRSRGRVALCLLGAFAVLVAVLANADVVGRYFTAHGHITEVVYVNVLRVFAAGAGGTLLLLAFLANEAAVANCLLLLAAIAFSFGFLESALRVSDYLATRGSPDRPIGLRRSSDSDLVYENTPNFYEDGDLKFNSLGLRDEERPLADNQTDIVVVGDSIEAWRALRATQLYPRVLESMLNARRPTPSVQTVNLGVSGYSLHQKVEMLRLRGLERHPKLVVVGYCLNDPIPAWELIRYFTDGGHGIRFQTIEFINNHVRSLLGKYGVDFYTAVHQPDTDSWRSVEEAFADLGKLQSEHGLPVVVIIFPLMMDTAVDYPWADIHRRVAAQAKQNGLVVVDLLDRFREAGLAHVRADGVHPNALGHQIAAEEVAAAIEREHLLGSRAAGNP